MMQPEDQLLDIYLSQSEDLFDRLDHCFVKLETDPNDAKCVGELFRAIHTIKGGAGVLGLVRIQNLAHAAEGLLSVIRNKTKAIDLFCTNILLESTDRLRVLVEELRASRSISDGDDTDLIGRIAKITASHELQINLSDSQIGFDELKGSQEVELFSESFIVKSEPHTDDFPSINNTSLVKSIKVNVGLLDDLMNLVSEMVLARNRLIVFAKNSGDLNFLNTVRNIDVVTMGLQERMMKTRMQPISNIWSKFPRLVRDLAIETDKRVDLIQIGSETELDRTLLETIRDPLTHIIRNCIDHGLESTEIRVRNGKKPTGTITLNAFHEKGMIVVEVDDDGAGMNLQLISKRAVEMELISKDHAQRLSDREIIDLIYTPGFSTKGTVSNISGRGVGMDVVRTNVHEIGGSVEIVTSGAGTKVRLRIPLTLAIMPAVFVRCCDQQFAIPQSNVVEMVRHQPEAAKPGVEDFCGVPVLRLRDRLIPLINLNAELGISQCKPIDNLPINIVLVQAAGVIFGLVADEILFMQDIVVKSVGPLMKGTPIYSGTTILGDGRVSLIFDVSGIAIRSGLISKLMEVDFQSMISEEASLIRDEADSFLLFDLNGLNRIALPLSFVDRLESIDVADIYQRGSMDVVMYGDQIMQLVWLDDLVDGANREGLYADMQIPVIVHYVMGKPVGFVVKKIFDIFHTTSDVIISGPSQIGISGSAIVNGMVVSFLNVDEILDLSINQKVPRQNQHNIYSNETQGLIMSKSSHHHG